MEAPILVLGLTLTLLAQAPASPQTAPVRPVVPAPSATRPLAAARACDTHNIRRAAVEPGALYVPGDRAVHLTPMTELPDAHNIKAVLRSVDGRCEVVVAGYYVSRPRPAVGTSLSGSAR